MQKPLFHKVGGSMWMCVLSSHFCAVFAIWHSLSPSPDTNSKSNVLGCISKCYWWTCGYHHSPSPLTSECSHILLWLVPWVPYHFSLLLSHRWKVLHFHRRKLKLWLTASSSVGMRSLRLRLEPGLQLSGWAINIQISNWSSNTIVKSFHLSTVIYSLPS